ncbi:hypothetical protein [Maribellus mangrovi]|uniref:hypothetical protein n=1 Tax=Maribellus mangrovi TaxID=3133146 RepID=UPI0030EE15EF
MKNLERGKENRNKVLNRLGLRSETVRMKYVLINGIPHKLNSNDELVPLKLKEKRYKSGKVVKMSKPFTTNDSHEKILLVS